MNFFTTLWEQFTQLWQDVFGSKKPKRKSKNSGDADEEDTRPPEKTKYVDVADTHDMLMERSNEFADQGDHEQALEYANQAIDLAPTLPRGYFARGNIRYAQRIHDQALSDFNEAIRLKPDYAPAYNNRGLVWFFGFGEPDKALADFDTSLKYGNTEPYIVHGNRGLALRMQGLNQAALAACNQALQLQPDSAEFVSNRALIQFALGDTDAAFNDVATALDMNPDLIYPYVNRALIHCSQGDYPAALADVAIAAQRDPTLVHTWLARSTTALLMDDLRAARDHAQRAYELQPERAETWGYLALVHYASGDKPTARAWWTKFVAQRPRYQRPENAAYFCDYIPQLMDIMRRMQAEFNA